MNSFQQVIAFRREYRMRGAPRFLFMGMGILLACLAFVTVGKSVSSSPANPFSLLMPVLFVSISVLMIAWPLRARVVVDGTRIEVRSLFSERSADLSEIEGFRTIQNRNGSYMKLLLKEDRGTITISKSFNFDDDARGWFEQVTDLDQRDRAALLDEISHDQELGATAEERLAKLSRATRWSIALTVASIAAAAAILFSHDSLRVTAAILLAAAPVAAFLLVKRSPLLYTILKPKRDPRGELSFVLIAPAIGLLLAQSGSHFVSFQPLLPLVVTVFLAYLLAFYQVFRKGPSRPGRFFLLLIFAGLYSAGLGAVADTISDHAPAKAYSAEVLHKRISRGRSTSYYLTLSPWGPIASPDEVSVSSNIFHSFKVGDQVCLSLHQGSLHAPWYRLVDCADREIPRPTQ
jgi:hypothetical protein